MEEQKIAQQKEASVLVREIPNNPEAEQTLLGALLNNNENIDRINDFFRPEHLYLPINVKIYELIMKFIDKGVVANPINLKKFLENESIFKDSGVNAYDYLIKLAANAQVIIDIKDVANHIYELAMRRELIRVGEEIVNESYRENIDSSVSQRIEKAEQSLFNLAVNGGREYDFLPIRSSVSQAIDRIEYARKSKRKINGLPTNFRKLDDTTGGLQHSDLLIVAARPSMGKTAFAINIGLNVANFFLQDVEKNQSQLQSVGIFSLEMSAEQIANRIISIKTGIEGKKIRTGNLTLEEFKKISYEGGNISALPIFIDDTAALSVSAIRTRARRMKRQQNLGLLIIDYLQLVRPSNAVQGRNRVEQIGEISQGLKEIAKELSVPVVALSQLSRAVEARVDKKPQLSDLRDSGNIEQDADVVMFLYREEYYLDRSIPIENSENIAWQDKMNKVRNIAEIIIAKQRNGPTGSVSLKFDSSTTNFQDED